MKSTPAMRARIRKLMGLEIDDYDRAVGYVLDDFEVLEAALREIVNSSTDIIAVAEARDALTLEQDK